MTYNESEIEELVAGEAPRDLIIKMQTSPKDDDRFEKYLKILQRRVQWKERILLPIGEHLYIVEKENEDRVVKCDCSHEFGDYRENWKLEALIYVRDTENKLEEIYPGPRKPDPELCEVREYSCPECGRLLEVEAVPPGYPPIFHFLPDIDEFYAKWLKTPLASSQNGKWFRDLTLEKVNRWMRQAKD